MKNYLILLLVLLIGCATNPYNWPDIPFEQNGNYFMGNCQISHDCVVNGVLNKECHIDEINAMDTTDINLTPEMDFSLIEKNNPITVDFNSNVIYSEPSDYNRRSL